MLKYRNYLVKNCNANFICVFVPEGSRHRRCCWSQQVNREGRLFLTGGREKKKKSVTFETETKKRRAKWQKKKKKTDGLTKAKLAAR